MWGSQGWNQWALQPAMFNDVPHEQIDWAALAKQWIQMQQTQSPDSGAPPLLPPVPTPPTPTPPATALSIIPPPPPGHSSVVPEEFPSEASVTVPLLKSPVTPAVLQEPFPTDRPFETEPAGFAQKPISNAYWNKSQWEASAISDIDERVWTSPSNEPASALHAGKETYDYGHMHDNAPLAMQSIDYNHMSEFSYNQIYPTESQYDQYWSQVNAAPPISPMFLKKQHTTATTTANSSLPVEEDTSQIDAAKRKQLPAWIREGLEKMEQERLKKLEKEKFEKEKAEKLAQSKLKKNLELKDDIASLVPAKSKFDSDSDVDTEEVHVSPLKQNVVSKRSPSPIEDNRTEEEKRQEYMLNIRRILTEVLLTVTNAEMYSIAEEVIRKEQLKARQLASTASLTSVASGLRCLANYGSGSEASDGEEEKEETDSDEELYRRMREKKKLFAIKEKKFIAELERKELEEQNEALKAQNEITQVASEPENSIKESEKLVSNEEVKLVSFIPSSDALDQVCTIPFIQEINVANPVEDVFNTANQELTKPLSKNSHSSDTSSSSSGSENELGDKHKKKSDKNKNDKSKDSDRSKMHKKEKSPRKHHRHRSSDSDSSDRHRKSRRSFEKTAKRSSSYKKKKKYKRSDSSSSSGSSTRKRKHSSKSEPSHNHSKVRRSRSYEDRDRRHRHSVSPKNYRSSRDSHRYKDSYSHRHEKDKYLKRDKDKYNYDYKRSPSPSKRSKLPKKYRSSRSPSSESENSGKKTKKSRTR